jgi:type I restriction enzyme S subunit
MSEQNLPIEVDLSEWKIIQDILSKIVPEEEVIAFGSRAKFLAKPYSDLDLALKGKRPLNLESLVDLRNAFSESDLRFKVDLVEWSSVSDDFRAIIEKDSVLIKRSL